MHVIYQYPERSEETLLSIVEKLIDLGADVSKEFQCSYPLTLAIKGGFNSIVKLLLKKGATAPAGAFRDWGVECTNLSVAMHAAARYSNIEAVKLLLEYGASINDWCYYSTSCTPLASAVSYGNKDMVKFLIKQVTDPYMKQSERGDNILTFKITGNGDSLHERGENGIFCWSIRHGFEEENYAAAMYFLEQALCLSNLDNFLKPINSCCYLIIR